MKLTYFGTVNQGVLRITNRKRFDSDLQNFEGKQVELTLTKKSKKRSLMQNNSYWGYMIPMIKDGLKAMGIESGEIEIHEFLKGRFNNKQVVNPDGLFIELPLSTTTLTTTEFMAYFASIQQWAAEFLNIQIPDPNTQTNLNYEQ
jgi:hypothetical protein